MCSSWGDGVIRPAMAALVDRVAALLARPDRVILGIAGPPGSGKSTVAAALVRSLADTVGGTVAVRLPMDGFHLADQTLVRLGRRDRKGAIDTFDAYGYLALLQRLRVETDHDVFAPGYDRTVRQPVAASVIVPAAARLVVTEGNYLLASEGPWPAIRSALDETWYVHVDEAERERRLVARHVRFGKDPDVAARWVHEVDAPNAALVADARAHADLVVDVDALGLEPEALTD
jgi:pantothenate kinase